MVKITLYYTNQTIEAYDIAVSIGSLRGRQEYVWEDFVSSYRWIIQQMNERIGHDDSYPIWLWKEKPDLTDEGHLEKGVNGVCLTIELPDERVLLSDFHAWHCVLNGMFLPLNEKEDELFNNGHINIEVEKSWERIFDLKLLAQSEYWGDVDQVIQVITGNLDISLIREVEYFTAK